MSENCSICYEELGPGKRKATPGKCRHVFCLSCLEQWALKHDTCPCCRGNFDKINVGGKRKRTIGLDNLRDTACASNASAKRKLRKILKDRIFNKGFVMRQLQIIHTDGSPVQKWKSVPISQARDGDVLTLDEMMTTNMAWVDRGSKEMPIEV